MPLLFNGRGSKFKESLFYVAGARIVHLSYHQFIGGLSMKYLLLIVFACCLVFSGLAPEANAFKDTNMEELQKKAEAGDPAALTQLGVAYMKGTGVEPNPEKGAELYRKAADKGYANAQWNLGFAYVRGAGVAKDYAQAAKFFRMAADLGYAPAEFDLGMMYLQGMGVARSRSQAIDWIVKASEHGYKEADAFLMSRGIEKAKPEEKKD